MADKKLPPSMGVYTNPQPKIAKTHTMRGTGAATKATKFSKNG